MSASATQGGHNYGLKIINEEKSRIYYRGKKWAYVYRYGSIGLPIYTR